LAKWKYYGFDKPLTKNLPPLGRYTRDTCHGYQWFLSCPLSVRFFSPL
jgi:hypothetical protein